MYFNEHFSYRRWDKFMFLKDKYTKEELELMYNEVVMYNLSQIFDSGYSRFIWRDLNELTVIGKGLIDDFTLNDHNAYLKDMTDRSLLADELMALGFYLPVYASLKEDGTIMVDSGKHRITSAKLSQQAGRWNGRKILTIETDMANVKHGPWIEKYLPEKMPKTFTMRIPMHLMFSVYYNTYDDSFIEEKLKSINGVRLPNDIIEIPVDKTTLFYKIIMVTGYWATEMFHVYRRTTNDNILPHSILNNEETFKEWVYKMNNK